MRPRIGLVLGGGGSRGIAHIGVLQILEQEQIPIDLIVGTSMGAIIGTLYGLGINANELAKYLNTIRGTNIFSVNLFSARARQNMVVDFLKEAMDGKTFEDLHIPVTVIATDMLHGKEVALDSGPLLPAVLASSAVPAVFPPVEMDELLLADGGVIDSLSTQVAFARGAEKVIAVDVYPALEQDNPWVDPLSAIMGFELPLGILNAAGTKPPGMLSSIWRAFRVMAWHIHEERLANHPPDVLLRPEVDNYGSLDFKDIDGPLNAGILETKRHLPALKALLTD